MIFLLCVDAVEVLEVVRQKGELELGHVSVAARSMASRCGRLTQSGLLAANRRVSYPRCNDACGQVKVHEPTWTIS